MSCQGLGLGPLLSNLLRRHGGIQATLQKIKQSPTACQDMPPCWQGTDQSMTCLGMVPHWAKHGLSRHQVIMGPWDKQGPLPKPQGRGSTTTPRGSNLQQVSKRPPRRFQDLFHALQKLLPNTPGTLKKPSRSSHKVSQKPSMLRCPCAASLPDPSSTHDYEILF